MKHSLRKRLVIIFIAIVAATLIIIGLLNYFFMDDFYLMQKKSAMIEVYEKADEGGSHNFALDEDCRSNNFTYIIADADMDIVRANGVDGDIMLSLMFGTMMNMDNGRDREIIVSNNDYEVSKFHDRTREIEFLQLFGRLDDEYYILMQCPLQSITIAAGISNMFYWIIGLIAVAASAAVILLVSKKLTFRIEELTGISERMAHLDFSAKYQSGGEDEIGKLGENFNVMSESLEKAMSQLQSANVKLKRDVAIKTQIDERRREFLSNVSHELKTPIALIQGYAEGVKEMELDKESRDMYLDVIVDESQKMNKLVMQLMNLEQIENGSDALELMEFDLTEVIKGVLDNSKIMIEQAGARIVFDERKSFPVYADEFRTEQVVTNYITNALHHLDGEKIIKITCVRESGVVKTTVFNTGEPIPEESLDKLWNKFYKVDKARTRSYGGSGIGLSIVKAIMEAHGQTCEAKNYENGVAFSFTLEAR